MLIDDDRNADLSAEGLHAHNHPLAAEANRANRICVLQEEPRTDCGPQGR
jgi:hypothetical protein